MTVRLLYLMFAGLTGWMALPYQRAVSGSISVTPVFRWLVLLPRSDAVKRAIG